MINPQSKRTTPLGYRPFVLIIGWINEMLGPHKQRGDLLINQGDPYP